MGSKDPRPLDRKSLREAAEWLRTLGHPARLRMVEMLLDGKYTVGELAGVCRIPSHVASGHLRLMQRCGFLGCRREGRRKYYEVADPCLQRLRECIEHLFGKRGS